jgi:hypothetical protein
MAIHTCQLFFLLCFEALVVGRGIRVLIPPPFGDFVQKTEISCWENLGLQAHYWFLLYCYLTCLCLGGA